MATRSLICIKFGSNIVNFRRHWGGDPVIVGTDLLDMLASAQTIRPRTHFSDGSWLLRLMFAHGDEGGVSLPTFEAYEINRDIYGDWEQAYCLEKEPNGDWIVSHVPICEGEPWEEIETTAKRYTVPEFRDFVDSKYIADQANGVTYDIQLKAEFERRFKPPR